jgi:hypothetical protein
MIAMTDQSIEFFVELNNKLSAEIARLEAEIASRDKVLELLKEADKKLSAWLGDCHARMHQLLIWMEHAQGNIPPELTDLIKDARKNLTLQQDAFLKEYGDWNKTGEN